jgi:GntR family transcriptional regulator
MRSQPQTHRPPANGGETVARSDAATAAATSHGFSGPSGAAASSTEAGAASVGPRFQPLYQQIKTAILQSIESGEWGAGQMIPSEMELARRYAVSQGTVRKAVESLAGENLLARRQGKGTYVSSHQEARAQFRFLRLRPDHGPATQPSSRIIECRRARTPADVARSLDIRPGASVLFIRRLLTFQEEPVVLDDIWLAGDEFRSLTSGRLARHSGQLYALLESELGTKMIHARECLRAVRAGAEEAASLGVEPGTPLLLVERVTSTFNGRPVELRRGLCRTDRHHYFNEL